VTLDASSEPLDNIANILSRYNDLQAVHIVSHASDGALLLGEQSITQSTLVNNAQVLRSWGSALQVDGDILLYGCNLSASDDGRLFAQTLSALTDADVASSSDVTGHALKNGDWDLEIVEGEIEAQVFADPQLQDDWEGALDITSGLIHHWTLDGNGNDSVGSANATYINGVGSPTGLIGQAADFGGDGNGLIRHTETLSFLFPAINTSDFTIGFWMHVNTAEPGDYLFGNLQAVTYSGFGLSLDANGQVVFEIREGSASQSVTSADSVVDSDWRYVVATRSGGQIDLDIYNRATQSWDSVTDSSAISAIPVGSLVPLRMGTETTAVGGYDGLLDDVRIYDRALSSADAGELVSLARNEQILVENNPVSVPFAGRLLLISN